MSQELGKLEKPSVKDFAQGRKLFFIPLVYSGIEPKNEYLTKFEVYWQEIEGQISSLEAKLGIPQKIYHELITVGNEEGLKVLKELNDKSYQIVKKRVEKGAQLELIEEMTILDEFLDWRKCLSVGLMSQNVFKIIYESYREANKRRNERIAKNIDSTLQKDEIGILLMREGHQVQFPEDINVFYISPPSLNELKRWLREQEN